ECDPQRRTGHRRDHLGRDPGRRRAVRRIFSRRRAALLVASVVMQKKKVAVVGGGATGASVLWAVTSQPRSRPEVELTLFHDEDKVGGHSRTIPVLFDAHGRGHVAEGIINEPTYAVDIGVQFVCETLYPNLYLMLEDPWFKAKVKLHRHPELKISGTFR